MMNRKTKKEIIWFWVPRKDDFQLILGKILEDGITARCPKCAWCTFICRKCHSSCEINVIKRIN